MSECQVYVPPHFQKPQAAAPPTTPLVYTSEATFEQFQQWQREQEQLKQSQQNMTEQKRQFQQFQQWQQQQQFMQWLQQQQNQSKSDSQQLSTQQQSQTRQVQVCSETNQTSHGQTTQQVPIEATSEAKSSRDGCGLFDVMNSATQQMSNLDEIQQKTTSQLQKLLTTFHTLVTNFENMLGVRKHVNK